MVSYQGVLQKVFGDARHIFPK